MPNTIHMLQIINILNSLLFNLSALLHTLYMWSMEHDTVQHSCAKEMVGKAENKLYLTVESTAPTPTPLKLLSKRLKAEKKKKSQFKRLWGDRGLLSIKCCRNKAAQKKRGDLEGAGRRGLAVRTCPALSWQSQDMTHTLCFLDLSVGYGCVDVRLNDHLWIWAPGNMSDCLVMSCDGQGSSLL